MEEPVVSPTERPTPPLKKLHQLASGDVAEELARMDGKQLRKIAPQELDDGVWMKKDKKYELAPNVMLMVQSFNRLALLVTTEILAEKTPQARAKVIGNFIKVAGKCHRLRNYNSLKAVLAGLQCTPIYRLSKTWKVVPSKKRKNYEQLSAVMCEEQNWWAYRVELERLLQDNASLVPFLGVFLTTVALQQQAQGMINSKLKETLRRNSTLCDDYVHLEAITVRNRLQRLRSIGSRDRPPLSVCDEGKGKDEEGSDTSSSPAADQSREGSESSESDAAMEDVIDSSQCLKKGTLCDAYSPDSPLSAPPTTPFSAPSLATVTENAARESDTTGIKRNHSNPLSEAAVPTRRLELENEVSGSPTIESYRKSQEVNKRIQDNPLQTRDEKPVPTSSPSCSSTEKIDTLAISGLPDRRSKQGGESLATIARRERFSKSKGSEMSRSLECLLDAGIDEENQTVTFRKQSSLSLEDLAAAKAVVASHCPSIMTPPAEPKVFSEIKKPNYTSPMALLKQYRFPSPKKLFFKRTTQELPPLDLSSSHQFRLASLQNRREGTLILPHKSTTLNESSINGATDLLQRYQVLSLGCPPKSGGGKVELRGITARLLVATGHHNTEAQNYKLSYEREPL